MTDATALVVGPPEHGVVRHARALAGAAGWRVLHRVDPAPADRWVVIDVTERLWGPTTDRSGPALSAALDVVRSRGARVAVALHDVPFEGDGDVFARRAVLYRSIVQRSDAVFVCSEVERRRLARIAPHAPRVAVLPLPVPAPVRVRGTAGTRYPERSVVVLGYLYPGKGHAEVLAAMAAIPSDVVLVCLGRPADGHDDLAESLRAPGRPVLVTGFLPDEELAGWLHAATVPIAPNRVVSASASIATWWAHGRRPLVPDVAYTREIGSDDTFIRYDAELPRTLHDALRDPHTTWLPGGVTPGPSLDEVVAARDEWLDRWSV